MAEREELTLRAFAALNARDHAGLMEVMAPDIELESRFSSVAGATYRGEEGVRRWLEDLDDAWEHFDVELEELYEESETTMLALVTLHARGRESGLEMHERVGQRHHWRGDRVFKIETRDAAEVEAAMRTSP